MRAYVITFNYYFNRIEIGDIIGTTATTRQQHVIISCSLRSRASVSLSSGQYYVPRGTVRTCICMLNYFFVILLRISPACVYSRENQRTAPNESDRVETYRYIVIYLGTFEYNRSFLYERRKSVDGRPQCCV